jgi:hypothetical protein
MSHHSSNLWQAVREMIWKKTNVWRDFKQFGLWPTLKRYYVLREAWWDKEDKIMAGQDKYGNIYWFTSKPADMGR